MDIKDEERGEDREGSTQKSNLSVMKQNQGRVIGMKIFADKLICAIVSLTH